jgi:predicted ATP-dependent endonuclease of OLD family
MRIINVSISNYRSFRSFQSEQQDTFSPSVNIIVGPNGSGKTNFLNAIRKCFDRGTYTSQTQYGESVSDFYDPHQPICIEISFEDVLGTEVLLYHRPSPDPGSDERVLNGKKVDTESKKWKEIKKHVFPSSFPRRIDNEFARHIAFDGDPLTNWQAINKAWKDIREDAERFIRLKLAEEPPLAECPHCEQPASQYASDLRDENDKPLLEGSDGYSHFLYLIMEIQKHRWPTVFLIEEPDVFMHPGLQKRFLEYLLHASERDGHQFFISTHSPYLLDFALRSGQRDSSPHVYRIFKQNGQSRLRFMNPKDRSDAWETLRELGHSSADVLHPNGIIWVEGPSDEIYLRSWLDCFAQKNGEKINWGVDCNILWYGGSNLAHIDVNFWEEEAQKLLNLLKINPQAAVLVDRDDYPKDNDKMKTHKAEVERACNAEHILFWMTEKGKRTIEDYISDLVRNKLDFPDVVNKRKVYYANRYKEWAEAKIREGVYDEIIPPKSHLEEQIGQLYNEITSWRGNRRDDSHSTLPLIKPCHVA